MKENCLFFCIIGEKSKLNIWAFVSLITELWMMSYFLNVNTIFGIKDVYALKKKWQFFYGNIHVSDSIWNEWFYFLKDTRINDYLYWVRKGQNLRRPVWNPW